MKDKPTAGEEWTADQVESIAVTAFIECRDGYAEVADAHNAALAAERERIPPPVDNKFVAEGCEQFGVQENTQRLENALAFADKTISGLHRIITGHCDQINQLEQQLAAEKEMVRKLGEQYKAEIHLRIDREQQIQTLTDELNRIREVATKTDWNLALRIDTVLEKVGKVSKKYQN